MPFRPAMPTTTDRCGAPRGASSSRSTGPSTWRAAAAIGEGLDHVPERIDGGGYGFGVQVIHDQRFGHIVGHSGGLPGYGSNMRWLPGRRVGAVALANSTYAPMRLLTRRMIEVLDDHGLVPPVVVAISPALQRAAEDLLALVNDWSDEAADALFADNVALDETYDAAGATRRRGRGHPRPADPGADRGEARHRRHDHGEGRRRTRGTPVAGPVATLVDQGAGLLDHRHVLRPEPMGRDGSEVADLASVLLWRWCGELGRDGLSR